MLQTQKAAIAAATRDVHIVVITLWARINNFQPFLGRVVDESNNGLHANFSFPEVPQRRHECIEVADDRQQSSPGKRTTKRCTLPESVEV